MGMLDNVYIPCPNCNHTVRCQSKSGSYELNDYTLENSPMEVLAGLVGDSGWKQCTNCKKTLTIKLPRRFVIGLEEDANDDQY